MDAALRHRIIDALLAHVRAGTTQLAPAEMYQPVTTYMDPVFAAAEREALFRREPLIAAHASELLHANDFVTADLAGVPVLVVRQADRSLKAFTNVCRHRGSRVESAARGNRAVFTCRFHAWAYDAAGRLEGVPCAPGFEGVDRAARGLVELPVEERHGMAWVVPTPGASIDVARHLGAAFDDELASWDLDAAAFERMDTLQADANWKLVVDGFLEDYHLPILHQATIGPYVARNLHDIEAMGPHIRFIAARDRLLKQHDRPADAVDFLRSVIVVYLIWPSGILVWQNDHFELWAIYPDARDLAKSYATARLLAPSADAVGTQRDLWERNWRILMDTVRDEDWDNARSIQAGIAGGGQTHFVFGRNEPGLQHFHRTLSERTAPYFPPAAAR